MAREIVTHVLCDVCMSKGLRTEGKEIPATTIGNLKPRVLALCEPDMKEFFDPFHDVLREYGQVQPDNAVAPRTSVSDDKKVPCPVCGKGLKSQGSLKSHGYAQHGLSVPEMRALQEQQAQGQLDLEAAAESPEAPVVVDMGEEFDREDCGVGDCKTYYARPKHQRPKQAVAVHRARAHGVRGAKAKKSA